MTLRIGIVGGGIRGRLFAETLQARSDVTVAGVADPARERLAWAQGISTFADHESLLVGAELDALVIATPDFAHFAPVAAAAERGLPILVEKPLTTDLDESLRLGELCAGAPVMVGFENRRNPLVRAIHEAATTTGPLAWQHIELSNTMEVPLRMLSWSAKSSPAWFLLPHTVDLAMWVAGEPITSVEATTGSGILRSRGIDTIDWIQAHLTFESGSSCQLTSSWILPDGVEPIVEFRYAANTAAGSVRADVIRGETSTQTDTAARPLTIKPLDRDGEEISAPQAMVHEFADRLVAGQELQPGLEHGIEVSRTIAMMLCDEQLRHRHAPRDVSCKCRMEPTSADDQC